MDAAGSGGGGAGGGGGIAVGGAAGSGGSGDADGAPVGDAVGSGDSGSRVAAADSGNSVGVAVGAAAIADSGSSGGSGGLAPEPVDEVLAALADPTRRRLLDLISARGAASATELAGELPVTRQAVVKHLAVLDAAGLVVGRRLGREVRYEVRSAALDATARWMTALAADWDRRLARIKAVAEAAESAEAAARDSSG